LVKWVPFDPIRDFTPIGLEVNSPVLLAVHKVAARQIGEGAARAGEVEAGCARSRERPERRLYPSRVGIVQGHNGIRE
jgi:hypothetical protein